MKLLSFALSCFVAVSGFAQFITHGPVVGGVTSTTARMYVRTTQAMALTVELSADSMFASGVITVTDSTVASRDSSVIIPISGLQPYTTYYYRVKNQGVTDTLSGHFITFPNPDEEGHYEWVVVSCQEYGTYNAFNAIHDQQPALLLHTGDWTYPDYMIPGDYRTDWAKVQQSYRMRYSEKNMPKVLRSTVTDYVVDNHDGAGARDNVQSPNFYIDSLGNVVNYISYDPVPAQGFKNVFDGYYENFPAFKMVDSTQGMYHSYKYGNAEVFFVDVRNCGNGLDSTFRYDSVQNYWYLDPRPGQTLLGQQQLAWLKNGLKNSTADWKFIVSGVMFNRKFRKIIEFAMVLQNAQFAIGGQSGTGFRLAHSLAWNWAGYPAEQDGLIDYLNDEGIEDVIVLSGHVHTNVMDDGFNSGLPELNTGPVAGTGPELTYYVDSLMQAFGQGAAIDSLWNGGGQGVNNKNFNSGFGKIEIFGQDSVVLQTIDENNVVVSSMTLQHSSKVTSVSPMEQQPECVIESLFPNPAKDKLQVRFCDSYTPKSTDGAFMVSISGQIFPVALNGGKKAAVNLDHLGAGYYFFVYDFGSDIYTQPVEVLH